MCLYLHTFIRAYLYLDMHKQKVNILSVKLFSKLGVCRNDWFINSLMQILCILCQIANLFCLSGLCLLFESWFILWTDCLLWSHVISSGNLLLFWCLWLSRKLSQLLTVYASRCLDLCFDWKGFVPMLSLCQLHHHLLGTVLRSSNCQSLWIAAIEKSLFLLQSLLRVHYYLTKQLLGQIFLHSFKNYRKKRRA